VIPTGMLEEAARIADNPPVIAAVPDPEVVSRKTLDELSPEKLAELNARLASGEVILGE
jgi:hypothetical protein